MKSESWILTEEICSYYRVEETFIQALHENELIHLKVEERKTYFPMEEIRSFERLRRLHYEMNINLEGLAAISELLGKVKKLRQENRQLKNRLRLYE